jgi:ABC-type lipoprotein export system ATPase subunit
MGNVIASLENVSREYDNGRIRAVCGLDLQIVEGDFLALLGASGSGKTTVLNLLTGLDTPTAGRIRFRGETPGTRSRWCQLRSRYIGYIFQSFNLLPTLTALENIEVPMFGNGLSAHQRRQQALRLLDRVGLSKRGANLPSELSGGERQRVAIARSLANRPLLLVADEPTGNLDSQTAAQIMALLEAVHRTEDTALLLVTHDRTFASRAKRVVHIADGKIIAAA